MPGTFATEEHWVSFEDVEDNTVECECCSKKVGITRYTRTSTGQLIGYACSSRCAQYAFEDNEPQDS